MLGYKALREGTASEACVWASSNMTCPCERRMPGPTDSGGGGAHQGDHVEAQQEGSYLQAKVRVLRRNQPHQHLLLGIGVSKTVGKGISAV